MTIKTYLANNVLYEYKKELNQTRRIARLKRILRQNNQDYVSISSQAKRRQLVEQISKEIIENFLTSETNNPIVLEIKSDLEKEMQKQLVFKYAPSNGEELYILEKTDKDLKPVSREEKNQILQKLWELTIKKVDQTML
ncbi:MAG: DVU0524 family FlgM-associated protein [Desulfonauticus sp.]|nr:DVU0524 family FlgM-associated protein [Desulfonauticus sp.]